MPSLDIAIDLIAGFAYQFGEGQQRQITRGLKRGQHLGAYALDVGHVGAIRFISRDWNGNDRCLMGQGSPARCWLTS